MDQNNEQVPADKVVASLQKDFTVVGAGRVKPWYAWAVLGIVFGVALGSIYVADRKAQFASSQAATKTEKILYIQSNSFGVRDLPLTGGSIEVAPIGTMSGTASEYETLQIKKPSSAYKKATLDKEFGNPTALARGVEFITVMRLADKKALKPEEIPAGGGFSFKVPVGVPADVATAITRAQLAFTSSENVLVLVNGVAQGTTYERSKGVASEVRRISLPQGVLQAGANVIEFQVIRPEKAQREFVLSFIVGLVAPAEQSGSLSYQGSSVVSKVQPSSLFDWVKRESAAGRLPAVGKYHNDRSGPRIMERFYITAPATPLVIEGFVFEKKNVSVKKAIAGVGSSSPTAYGGGFPGVTLVQVAETDPRLATMRIDAVSAATVDPATGVRTPMTGVYSVTNTEEKTLTFTAPSPITVQPLTTIVLEFYGDPRTPLADSDLLDAAVRYALVLQEPFRFTRIALAGGEQLVVKNNVDTRVANPLPGLPASLSVARDNFFNQRVVYTSKPMSTPWYSVTAGGATATPVYELDAATSIYDGGLLPEAYVFAYDVQMEEGGPRLTDFIFRGIKGVEITPGKILFDFTTGTPTISAYDPHFKRVIAKAVPGTKAKAKATYQFRFLPAEARMRVRNEVLGPDALSSNVKYEIGNAAVNGVRSLDGVRPIVVSNP